MVHNHIWAREKQMICSNCVDVRSTEPKIRPENELHFSIVSIVYFTNENHDQMNML